MLGTDNLAFVAAAAVFVLSLITLIILFVIKNKQSNTPAVSTSPLTQQPMGMGQQPQQFDSQMNAGMTDQNNAMENMNQNLQSSAGIPNEGMMANPTPDPSMQVASGAPEMNSMLTADQTMNQGAVDYSAAANPVQPAMNNQVVPEVPQMDTSNMQTVDLGGQLPQNPVQQNDPAVAVNPIVSPEPVMTNEPEEMPQPIINIGEVAPNDNPAINELSTQETSTVVDPAPVVTDPVMAESPVMQVPEPVMPSQPQMNTVPDPISQMPDTMNVGGSTVPQAPQDIPQNQTQPTPPTSDPVMGTNPNNPVSNQTNNGSFDLPPIA